MALLYTFSWLRLLLALLLVELGYSQVVTFSGNDDALLAGPDAPAVNIILGNDEDGGVVRVAHDLAADMGRVVGVNGTVSQTDDLGSNSTINGDNIIIVGTVTESALIKQLVDDGKLDVSEIEGQWESYVQAVVKNPADGIPQALVIAGSDKRGAIYGAYDISETIGVSPWYWWANVPAKTKDGVYLVPSGSRTQGSPSVKYRGIFINDENQLMVWAEGRFPQSDRGTYLTSPFYALIFELLLRLKANYLWPGMKATEAFYIDDPKNGPVADYYGIIMGTSHHEPMARAFNEQLEFVEGDWDWGENSENITEFMRKGAERSKNWDTLYTMGMRGTDDAASPTLTPEQLEEIIKVQQGLISDATEKDLADVPQAWCLYKEVVLYWAAGMNISELVTLLWTDDNFGNLIRTPLTNETERAGGAGIYYHFGYVGLPRDYEWINTNQLVKAWEQLHLAYTHSARNIWIANVQDVKPFEVPMNLFLDMAYDMSQFQTPDTSTEWLKRWARREFEEGVEDVTAQIYNTYGRLILRRKYETLINMGPFPYSTLNYDEASKVLQEWKDLAALAQRTHAQLDSSMQDTYWELVVDPPVAGEHVLELYTSNAMAQLYKSQGRTSTNMMTQRVLDAFEADAATTDQYHSLWDGKFDHIMDNPHIGYDDWLPPEENNLPELTWISDDDVDEDVMLGVAVQGLDTSAHEGDSIQLRSVDPYMPPGDQRYIEVFTSNNGTYSYKIQSNVSYVSVTSSSGTLSAPGNNSDVRCSIDIDWDSAPDGLSWAALEVSRTDSDSDPATALLPVNKTSVPASFTGFVESNGVVSIEPVHWADATSTSDAEYVELPHYGRTLSGVKLWPATAPSQETASGPRLRYRFHTSTETAADARVILYFGATLDHDPTRPLRVAHALDAATPAAARVLGNYGDDWLPDGWTDAVLNGGYNMTAAVDAPVAAGAHTLDVWLLEPGLILQKVVVDLGGFQPSLLGPPESARV